MKRKRLVAAVLAVCLTLGLCACGKKKDDEYFLVVLQTVAGSGFFWECSLSEEGVVTMECIAEDAEELSAGSTVLTEFRFFGEEDGTVTATFRCTQSWDESVFYLQTCELSVDSDQVVTGEMGTQMVVFDPGENFSLEAEDPSLLLWTKDENGVYTLTPQHDGSTTLIFTDSTSGVNDIIRKEYFLTVTEEGMITVAENTEMTGSDRYPDLAELERKVGFSMPVPESAEVTEISSVGSLAFVNFRWRDYEFAYVGGEMNTDEFFTEEANIMTINSVMVGVNSDNGITAGWTNNDCGYYIATSDDVESADLSALLTLMISSAGTEQKEGTKKDSVQIQKLG